MLRGVSAKTSELSAALKDVRNWLLILSAFDEIQQRDGLEVALAHVAKKFPDMEFDSEHFAEVRAKLETAYANVIGLMNQAKTIMEEKEL